ncbi:MAG: type II toxin-antitoxin system PemK/MazF family toxin, partial [Chloroflexi bacterium]
MGRFVRGAVVVLPFPFSDLTASKKRPALVVAELTGDDVICCMITSQRSRADHYAIELSDEDFINGHLQVDSYIRPNRLFTADTNIIDRQAGQISTDKL